MISTILKSLSLLIIFTHMAGCTDTNMHTSKLIAQLEQQSASLQPIAEKMLVSGNNAIIDLRETPTRIFPTSLNTDISTEELTLLQNLEIEFVACDQRFGGVIFAVQEEGIGISGRSLGFVYQKTEAEAETVADLAEAFRSKQAEMKKHQSVDLIMIQPIRNSWGIYLETF